VLTEAVHQHIPAGTPVALRVFGDKEPDSCRTDLEIPLAPLDPAAVARKLAGINAMNLARTPIADSLAAVAGDLKGAGGRGAIVLVTDGEETCDGDPAAVIESLQKKGVDVSLNIVGFAIGDAELETKFENWAELGNGRYFGAQDQEGLSNALREALRIPFTVYDMGGNEVGQGLVGGEAIELEQGYYRVEIASSPPQTFARVEVPGEKAVTLNAGQEGVSVKGRNGAPVAAPAKNAGEKKSAAPAKSTPKKSAAPAAAAPARAQPSAADSGGDDLVRMVQQQLILLGYDPGPADGKAGTKTMIAISQFQAEKGMKVTGKASPQLAGILAAEVDAHK
jgi:hypothetical protein